MRIQRRSLVALLLLVTGCTGIKEEVRFNDLVLTEHRAVGRSTDSTYHGTLVNKGKELRVQVVRQPHCFVALDQQVERTKVVHRTAAPPHEHAIALSLGFGIPFLVAGSALLGTSQFFSSQKAMTTNSDGTTSSTSSRELGYVGGGLLVAGGLPLTIIGIVDAVRLRDSREKPTLITREVATNEPATCADEPAREMEIIARSGSASLQAGTTDEHGELRLPRSKIESPELCMGSASPTIASISTRDGTSVGEININAFCEANRTQIAEQAARAEARKREDERIERERQAAAEEAAVVESRRSRENKEWSSARPDECIALTSSTSCQGVVEYLRANRKGPYAAQAEALLRKARARFGRCFDIPPPLLLIVNLQVGNDYSDYEGCGTKDQIIGHVITTTRDGWMMIEIGQGTFAAVHARRPRIDGSMYMHQGFKYVGVQSFVTTTGANRTIASFVETN